MFLNHFFTFIPLLVFLQLLVYVLYLDWKAVPNRLMAIILAMLLISAGCDYYYLVTHNTEFITNIFKINSVFWELMAPLFIHSFTILFENKQKPLYITLLYLLPIPSIIHIFKEQSLLSVNNNNLWGWKFESDHSSILFWYSALLPFLYLLFFIYFTVITSDLNKNYRVQKQASIIRKAAVIAVIFMYFPWYLSKLFHAVNYPVYQNFGAMIVVIAIVYGMSRYRLQSLETTRILTDLIEHSSEFIIIISPDGNILSVNRENIPYSGYEKQELEGKSIEIIVDDNVLLKNELKKVSKRAVYSPNIELGIKSKSNDKVVVKTGINAIRNQFGEVLGYYLVFYGRSGEVHQFDQLQAKYDLTDREKEVALLLVRGLSNQEIADALFISLATVKSHTHNIYQKTVTRNKAELHNLLVQN